MGAELKDRTTDRIRAWLGEIPGMAEMYVGTIHGYCLQLRQAHMPDYSDELDIEGAALLQVT